jgi:hypothetical protein
MRKKFLFQLFLAVITLLILVDFILFLSGHNTYFLGLSPIGIDLSMFFFVGLIVYFCFELFILASKKKWKVIFSTFIVLLAFEMMYKVAINRLADISLLEAKGSIVTFLRNNNTNSRFNVHIENGVRESYNRYISENDRALDALNLSLKVPHLHLYEFEVVPRDTPRFFVRIKKNRFKDTEIWVHSGA